MKAVWKGETIAESDETVVVEGNHYFPADSVVAGRLEPSEKTSVCPWKGTANYYDVVAGDQRNNDAAWCYATPKKEAANIKDYVAFWRGVEVS